jgi:hypothetical protein
VTATIRQNYKRAHHNTLCVDKNSYSAFFRELGREMPLMVDAAVVTAGTEPCTACNSGGGVGIISGLLSQREWDYARRRRQHRPSPIAHMLVTLHR